MWRGKGLFPCKWFHPYPLRYDRGHFSLCREGGGSFKNEKEGIEKAERYDVKGKKYMSTPYKFYFSDIGLRNSFINFRQNEETHIMENVIYLELKRRGFNVDVGVIELKERKENEFTYKQLEVDFIANKGNNKIYIQSAFSLSNEEKTNQEERPLLKIEDSFKKIRIVKDYIKRTRNENGIIKMSIFDFLLDPNSLDY